jgi:hypothetical protein
MVYQTLAELVLMLHLAFVLFVVLGGFLVFRWRRVAWLHVPACMWGTLVELSGWLCPLTPLENWLRQQGGGQIYRTGFIEHYLLPLLYPAILTRGLQIFLGLLVMGTNLGLYGWLFWRQAKKKETGNSSSHN